jgi:hypothetical protein
MSTTARSRVLSDAGTLPWMSFRRKAGRPATPRSTRAATIPKHLISSPIDARAFDNVHEPDGGVLLSIPEPADLGDASGESFVLDLSSPEESPRRVRKAKDLSRFLGSNLVLPPRRGSDFSTVSEASGSIFLTPPASPLSARSPSPIDAQYTSPASPLSPRSPSPSPVEAHYPSSGTFFFTPPSSPSSASTPSPVHMQYPAELISFVDIGIEDDSFGVERPYPFDASCTTEVSLRGELSSAPSGLSYKEVPPCALSERTQVPSIEDVADPRIAVLRREDAEVLEEGARQWANARDDEEDFYRIPIACSSRPLAHHDTEITQRLARAQCLTQYVAADVDMHSSPFCEDDHLIRDVIGMASAIEHAYANDAFVDAPPSPGFTFSDPPQSPTIVVTDFNGAGTSTTLPSVDSFSSSDSQEDNAVDGAGCLLAFLGRFPMPPSVPLSSP